MKSLVMSVVFLAAAAAAVAGPDDYCHGQWQGEPFAAVPWYHIGGQEYYAVYQDPRETGCPDVYPFEVQNVFWWVDNGNEVDVELEVCPVIYTVDRSDPECPRPGVVWCRGEPVTLIVYAYTWTQIVLPLGGCCVTEPYFAGVEIPSSLGYLSLGLVVDNGVSMVGETPRPCAGYSNREGYWMDLVFGADFQGNLMLWSDGYNSAQNDCDGCTRVVEAGVDLWLSGRDGLLIPPDLFVSEPLPADFFGPGSDPFDNPINFEGQPIPVNPADNLGGADAIVERREEAILPTDGSSDQVETEMVALKLVSSEPIIVTFWGGANWEEWNVTVCLSNVAPPPPGIMNIVRECCNGGGFQLQGQFRPRFIFSQIQGLTEFVLDYPGYIDFVTTDGRWSAEVHPPYNVPTSPGLVAVDHDCNGASPDIIIPPSSKFIRSQPGHPWFPDACDCCVGRVGDANNSGTHEPTIGDITAMIDAKFITGTCVGVIECIAEADVNLSGTLVSPPLDCDDITIGDITKVIDYLFITGKENWNEGYGQGNLPPCP